MAQLDASILRAIAPKVAGKKAKRQAEIIAAVGPVLASTLARYQINTKLRIAHFLAQVAHECDGFATTQEYADGSAYNGRKDLGNTKPGDGQRYKGRGLIQLTGRFNYRSFGATMKLPLEENPEIAAQPVISLTIACEYWKDRKLNAFADKDDIETITRRINGGLNGFEDRKSYLRKAKAVLAGISGPLVAAAAPEPAPAAASAPGGGGGAVAGAPLGGPLDLAAVAASGDPVLRNGASGDDVLRLQYFLKAKGIEVDPDGDFGPGTETAVMQFQAANDLDPDGIVGARTWALLRA